MFLQAERLHVTESGEVVQQTTEGFGDLTLALPVTNYYSLADRSGAFTVSSTVCSAGPR